MPPLSELPGEVPRQKFLAALRRVGFDINEQGGDGSHCKVTWPKTQKSVTIPTPIYKQRLKYILKEIESYSGITWENIKEQL